MSSSKCFLLNSISLCLTTCLSFPSFCSTRQFKFNMFSLNSSASPITFLSSVCHTSQAGTGLAPTDFLLCNVRSFFFFPLLYLQEWLFLGAQTCHPLAYTLWWIPITYKLEFKFHSTTQDLHAVNLVYLSSLSSYHFLTYCFCSHWLIAVLKKHQDTSNYSAFSHTSLFFLNFPTLSN